MQRTQIAPEILQPFFESSANAADKGQSQFFTPSDLGRTLARPLAPVRPIIVDLNCGAGHLLQASAQEGKPVTLLGADIDPCHGQRVEGGTSPLNRITADACQLHAWLREVGFKADCWVLNPPWRLFFYRARLAALLQSEFPAVRAAFKGIEQGGGIPRECIDSTLAMLLIALDLCTPYGEGLLIANHDTLERLIFAEDAPHGAVAAHVWARLIIPGNPMTARKGCNWQEDDSFQTEVLYFAREHTAGPHTWHWPELPDRSWRQGVELRNAWLAHHAGVECWSAAKEKAGEAAGNKVKVPWNLWLASDNTIHTALSLFEKHSSRINKHQVQRLFALNGKTPMDLVIQRNTRDELLEVAERSGWRVQPDLLAAVREAIRQYHAARAPLYPLPEIQRLGYLDEEDTIECKADLAYQHKVIFRKGQRYPLRSETISFTRQVQKPNSFTGDLEELEYSGQELVFLIAEGPDKDAPEWSFMDQWLRDDKETTVANAKRAADNRGAVDFTLADLVRCFVIPEVPDVAAVDPAAYRATLVRLDELEAALAIA
ncbi:MAG TPA: hypothetical protein VMU04_10290 [Candidatus Acidoferrum sp.]|nr:hypothetical protein [Candidatus Acidoferrum sp.]